MPIPKTFRGPTAKGILKLEWDYPVYSPPVVTPKPGESFAKQIRRALPREQALKVIAGDDPRPLLVLRECKVCNGTDDALLKGGMENEKTFLLATWFHCVKLPADVLEEDHPFHNLFQEKQPEHLFVSSIDGSNHDPLESQTSRTELWKSLSKLIGAEYKKKPESSLKKLARLLDKLDTADSRWNDLMARRDDVLEKDGPKSKKLPKLAREIEELEEDRAGLLEEVAKASLLELKKREVESTEAAPEKKAKAG